MKMADSKFFEITRDSYPSFMTRFVREERPGSGVEETVSEALVGGLLYKETFTQLVNDQVDHESTWVTLHIPSRQTRRAEYWQGNRDLAAALIREERRIAREESRNSQYAEPFLGKRLQFALTAAQLFGDEE